MSDQFDPYYVWLGIPPRDQPPNHYRLLGLEVFEENLDVIDAATNRQTSYLHEMATGPNRKHSQELLNEIASARSCLLDPERKQKYDAKLKKKLAEKEAAEKSEAAPTEAKSEKAAAAGESSPPAESAADDNAVDPADATVGDDASKSETDTTTDASATETVTKVESPETDSSDSESTRKRKSDRKGVDTDAEKKQGGDADKKKSAGKDRKKKSSHPGSKSDAKAKGGDSPGVTPARKKSGWMVPASIGGGVIVMGIVLAVALGGGDDTPAGDGQQTTQNGSDTDTDGQPDDPGSESQDDPDGALNPMSMLPPLENPADGATNPNVGLDSLVANWRFDEKDDQKAVDSVSRKKTATFEGKPTFTEPAPYGAAVKLNGTTDRIELAPDAFSAAEGTLAMWVRRDVGGKAQRLSDSAGGRFVLELDEQGLLSGIVGSQGDVQRLSSKVALAASRWYHVALTWKSEGPAVVFCNGEEVATVPRTDKLAAPTQATLGYALNEKQFAAVSLDDVRLFARPLGQGDVKQLIMLSAIKVEPVKPGAPTQPSGPTITADKYGLVAHYQFADSETIAKDARENYDATNHGATLVDDQTLKTKVLNFDGKDDWFELPGPVDTDFMITFWMKTSERGPPTPDWKAGNRVVHAGDALFGISVVEDRLVFGTGQGPSAHGKTIINDGAWHFIAATRKDDKLALLIDGVKESPQTVTGKKGALKSAKIAIGRSVDKADKFFTGQIADVRFFTKVLNPHSQILKQAGGDRWTKFDETRPKPPGPSNAALPYGAVLETVHHDIYTELAAEKSLQPLRDAIKPQDQGGKKAATSATATRKSFSVWLDKDCANTGRRVTGFLIPPLDGMYRISARIADHGRFSISTDASPAGLAEVTEPVKLEANRLHYFELLYKCDDDNGGYSISWILPDGSQEAPIPGHRIAWSPHFRSFVTLPVQVKSDKDNSFTTDESGAILVEGSARSGSTYEVDVNCAIEAYSAFRLDALLDESESIPLKGPGLGTKGAFSVTDFSVFVKPPGQDFEQIPRDRFLAPIADAGIPRYSGDDKSTTGWGKREGGDPASLVLRLPQPWIVRPGTVVRFKITCNDNLGKFRVRGTSAPHYRLDRMLAQFSENPARKVVAKFALGVNLGGAAGKNPQTGQTIHKTRGWSSKVSWGHEGGSVKAGAGDSPQKDPIVSSCVEGIKSFRVRVPADGSYEVGLLFSENLQKDVQKRIFDVQIGAGRAERINPLLAGRGYGGVFQLKRTVRLQEGEVLVVKFAGIKDMLPPILNAISVVQK